MAEAPRFTDRLDKFQQTLLQMTSHASAAALSKFVSTNYQPLYQFILRLYLTSLTSEHTDRGHTSNYNKNDGYTVKEHKILSQFANLLTDDEPLNKDPNPDNLQQNTHHHTNHYKSQSAMNNPLPSPTRNIAFISSSNTSKITSTCAKVNDTKKYHYGNKQKQKHSHEHSPSLPQFSANFNRGVFAAYPQHKKHRKKPVSTPNRTVRFGDRSDRTMPEIKIDCDEDRNVKIRRGSIWDGVVDVNNIIMMPETPKWRPRFSFQQNQLLQEGLLNSILCHINGKEMAGSKGMGLMDEVAVTSVDAMCLYLPFLVIISSKLNCQTSRDKLQRAILQRAMNQVDIKQHFQFCLNSYKDVRVLIKRFMSNALFKESKTKNAFANMSAPNVLQNERTLPGLSGASISVGSQSKAKTTKLVQQHISQQVSESALSLFQSIFRLSLAAGSEIKLCRDSLVRDPIHCHAPPLSRIEIRKVIASNSKPYLVDLYVSNRSDNFEYLSSTVILKKGDDLRRDAAVLHVFRLMNKIWREKGLQFTQVPVNALTYKCVAMSATFGMIELIAGCKPLRLVSALEDTITIAQQFNLVASAAGSYMASYVMGVRDRHFDNVLIRDADCTLFHIDFGFVLGDTVGVDTSKFAITKDLKKLMGQYWDKFIELGVAAFLALRRKYKYLCKYATVAFEYLENTEMVTQFIKYQLRIDDMSDEKAAKYIARKLKESPDSVKTKFKNAVHQLATIKK